MNNIKNIVDIIISAVALAIIAGCVTAALAGTNALTKGTIDEMNNKAATAARQQVIDAEQFEKCTLKDNDNDVIYYTAKKNGQAVGYVFTAITTGKSSGLSVMTGISVDGKITGVTVTDDHETAGYVDKVKKGGLFGAFTDKEANKEFTLGTDIDGVSQATKTSRGVTRGVNKAVNYYTEYIKEAH